jgi:hypothetical protein
MLSMRSAITEPNVEGIAAAIADVIIARTFNRSPAQWLRSVVGGGLHWFGAPSWLGQSLRQYDANVADFFPATVARYPDPMPVPGEIRSSLLEVLRAPTMHDGVVCTLIGHQMEGAARQVLTGHFSFPTDVGQTPDPATPDALVSYVFQLKSVEFDSSQFTYVHCVGPYSSGWGPWAQQDELCWVTGLPIAHGAIHMSDGNVGQCVYITACSVCFTPKVSSEGEFLSADDG